MRVSDQAIVLQSIRYGDKKFILKMYSRHNGLLTAVAVPGNSPSSKIRMGLLQPMALLDVVIVRRENREVQRLTEASCYYVCNEIPQSMSRLSIAQFMNEILLKSLKEHSANSHLYDLAETCVKYLNESEDFMNLHLYLMLELSRYLGIEPHNNFNASQTYFDCREGRFDQYELAFPLGLNAEESRLFSDFMKSNCLHERLSNQQRQKLLEILVAYYQLHIPSFGLVKSLEVLKEVMGSMQRAQAS